MLLLAEPILTKYSFTPTRSKTLAIVLVGSNPASEVYVGIKTKKAEFYGVATHLIRLPDTCSTEELCSTIQDLNADDSVDAVIVQLPLPASVNTEAVLDCIDQTKDVDNLTGKSRFTSPMVQAILALMDEYKISLEGKTVCVVGHGRLVGQPIVEWLVSNGINPTVIASADAFDDDKVQAADVVIAGTGSKFCINANNTREGQIVFDCSGMDVDFEAVKDRVMAITPPKGGIGPLTVHFLLTNVIKT